MLEFFLDTWFWLLYIAFVIGLGYFMNKTKNSWNEKEKPTEYKITLRGFRRFQSL